MLFVLGIKQHQVYNGKFRTYSHLLHHQVVSNGLLNLDEEFGKNKIGGLITKQPMEEACGQISLNGPRKREYLWMT